MKVLNEDFVIVDIDGLTCDVWDIPDRIFDDGCDCPRREVRNPDLRAATRHRDECAVNGIYAELYEQFDIGEVYCDLLPALLG